MDKIISQPTAKLLELVRYFTGKPCRRGHVTERYTKSGACVGCDQSQAKLRYGTDPSIRRASSVRSYHKHKSRVKNQVLIKKYGLSLDEHSFLSAEQNHQCLICNILFSETRHRVAYVDHCHKTEVVRGLLCGKCNVGLGHFNDDPLILLKAIAYLEKSKPLLKTPRSS